MPELPEKFVKRSNEFIVRALCILRHIPIYTVRREVIGDTLGIVVIPGVEVTFDELGRLHE